MIHPIEREVMTTVQEIQKRFSVQDFENKFVSIIENYVKNSEELSYYDMRSQLDMYFGVDMNPLFIYIINGMSMSCPNINPYIKVIDKIKYQYGSILHRKHEAAVNPFFHAERCPEKATASKAGKVKYGNNMISSNHWKSN